MFKTKTLSDISTLYEMLVARGIGQNNVYKAFHPLVRVKGHINKMHVTKLVHYSRLVYLNPIEGVPIGAHLWEHQVGQKASRSINCIWQQNKEIGCG